MRHRHLDDPGFTLAAIDDIIERGQLEDWVELGLAARNEAVRARIARIVDARSGDQSTINHDFWRSRLTLPQGPDEEVE